MPIIQYQRGDVGLLRKVAAGLEGDQNLLYPEFVDHYYAGSPWCRLWIAQDDNGQVSGVVGVERMKFTAGDRQFTLGFGTNFISLRPGAGGGMVLKWLKDCDYGLVLGATDDALKVFRGRMWTPCPNVRRFLLNSAYAPHPSDAWWKRLAKGTLRCVRPKVDAARRAGRIWPDASGGVEAVEEHRFSEDLLPEHAEFTFRFSPTVEYLTWRYNLQMPLVRYRLFRILRDGRSAGYVIMHEQSNRWTIAHGDAEDHLVFTRGIVAAVADLSRLAGRPREVFLLASHTAMQANLRRLGFRELPGDYPMFLGSLRGEPPLEPDTSEWLVNFDWGDNGLRPPFFGLKPISTAEVAQRNLNDGKETPWPPHPKRSQAANGRPS